MIDNQQPLIKIIPHTNRSFFIIQKNQQTWLKAKPNSILLFLAIFHLSESNYLDDLLNDSIMDRINVATNQGLLKNVPPFYNLLLMKDKIGSMINDLKLHSKQKLCTADMLNKYPELQIILVSAIRLYSIYYYQKTQQIYEDMMFGNEMQILSDYQTQPRQTALTIISDSVCTKLCIKNDCQQQFGRYAVYQIQVKFQLSQEQSLCYCFKELNSAKTNYHLKNYVSKLKLRQNIRRNDNNSSLASENIEESKSTTTLTKEKRWKRKSNSKGKLQNICRICKKKTYFCQCKNNKQNPMKVLKLLDPNLTATTSNQKVTKRNNRHLRCDSVSQLLQTQIINHTDTNIDLQLSYRKCLIEE